MNELDIFLNVVNMVGTGQASTSTPAFRVSADVVLAARVRSLMNR